MRMLEPSRNAAGGDAGRERGAGPRWPGGRSSQSITDRALTQAISISTARWGAPVPHPGRISCSVESATSAKFTMGIAGRGPSPLPAAAGTWDCHLLPSWVYTSDCNNVLKFETLEAEFGQLMADKLGASGATLPVNNAASCTMLTSSLDDRARELVRTVYARDFELFGYSTDVPEDAIGFLDSAEVAQIDRELARSGRAAASGESRGSRGPDDADALKVSPS